jgi:hypothetical protein
MGTLLAIDWLVIAAGLAAIAWVNCYVFLVERTAAVARATVPVRLVFGRHETARRSDLVAE